MRGIKELIIALSLVLVVTVAGLVQFSQPNIIGADGFLHGYMAKMVSDKGFIRSLPQAHFSWFNTNFSDKDFIYHLYLAPLVRIISVRTAVKIGAFFATSMLFITTVLILSRYVPFWGILPLSMCLILTSEFLRDTAEARPFILAITLTVIGIFLTLNGRIKLMGLLSFVFEMTHLSAWTMPVFTIVWTASDFIMGGKIKLKIIIASLAGYLVSFLVHPNFPNNLFFSYLNGALVPYYAAKTGVLELGAEFFPINTLDLIHRYPVLVFGAIITATLILVLRFQVSRSAAGWGLALIMFGIMGLVAVRNITHLYPIFIIFAGAIIPDISNAITKFGRDKKRMVVTALGIVIFIIINYSLIETLKGVNMFLEGDRIYARHFEKVAGELEKFVLPGSRIFHTNWSDSQYLIGLAPQYEYLVTLDPVYMYTYDEPLYRLYRKISFGGYPDPYTVLEKNFGTNSGYAGKNYFSAFINQIRSDTRFKIRYEDEFGVVFTVSPSK